MASTVTMALTWLVVLLSGSASVSGIDWLFYPDNTECFEDPPVGCFTNTGPYRNAGGFLPDTPDLVGVGFIHLSSAANLRVTWNQSTDVTESGFDPSLKTVFIVHGYYETGRNQWIAAMAERLLAREAMNVFAVDWQEGANRLNYYQSASNTKMVGAITALFIEELMQLGASPSNMHVIGFSLGAQVAGQIGMRVPGLGRITGLDPAGPAFEGYDPLVRLDPTDAEFVDVIHTDTGGLRFLRDLIPSRGILHPCGTVDFYPNSGHSQPGCPNIIQGFSAVISDMNLEIVQYLIACDHFRAPALFSSTISEGCQFQMSHCDDHMAASRNGCTPCEDGQCPTFGYDIGNVSDTLTPRIYRFSTTGSFPFCCTGTSR